MHIRNVIIDCDTGVDDALALLLALRSPTLDVIGITCVAGNVDIDKVVRNTLVTVEHAGKKVPVYRGASGPLLCPLETAAYAHGQDGLGNIGFPPPSGREAAEHAVDFLVETYMQATQPVLLITQAPLTNIALALLKEPRLAERIPAMVMMAGGIDGGNVTAAAEFNVWVDPEAADIVFRSPIPKTMVALDPIREGGTLEESDIAAIEQSGAPWCQMAARLARWQMGRRWAAKISPPDLAAMAVAIDPSIAQSEMYHVAIETQGRHTRGMTVVDRRPFRRLREGLPEPNVNTVTAIDNLRFRRLVTDTWRVQQ